MSRVKSVLLAGMLLSCAPLAAKAGVIPYGSPGVENPVLYSFTAIGGEVKAYFAGASAAYTNLIGLRVNGVDTGIVGLDNHTSALGQSLSFGSVSAGASLVFYMKTNGDGGNTYYSTKALNTDGFNHLYATAFTGGAGLPGFVPHGTYLGWEDIRFGGDRDYNDTSFVVTGVPSGVPEPSTWAMMMLGLAGLGWLSSRRGAKATVRA